jgi:Skp family chaperone for outer membrane proteins
VALQPVTQDEIARIEDDLADVVAKLRKMRQEWADAKAESLDLEIEKAARFVEYLKQTWIHRVNAQFGQSLARRSAEQLRAQMTSRKK